MLAKHSQLPTLQECNGAHKLAVLVVGGTV